MAVPCKRNNGVDAAEAPQSLIHNTSGGAGIKQIGCKRLRVLAMLAGNALRDRVDRAGFTARKNEQPRALRSELAQRCPADVSGRTRKNHYIILQQHGFTP
jgi:hypothetical protein